MNATPRHATPRHATPGHATSSLARVLLAVLTMNACTYELAAAWTGSSLCGRRLAYFWCASFDLLVLLCFQVSQRQRKKALADLPSIDSAAAVPAAASAAAGGSGGGVKPQQHATMAFLNKKAPAQSVIQIDDPALVGELKESEQDDLVSEVILALKDRSLPLHMRDSSATLLKGFRSQDAEARKLALDTAASIATSANSEIDILRLALNERLDIFIESFRTDAARSQQQQSGAWAAGASTAAAAADNTMDAADVHLFCALNQFSATIRARQIKVAASGVLDVDTTDAAGGAEDEEEEEEEESEATTLDVDTLNRYSAGVAHAPSDVARRAAGAALCEIVAAYHRHDPSQKLAPQLQAWAKDVCTSAVDAVADSGAAGAPSAAGAGAAGAAAAAAAAATDRSLVGGGVVYSLQQASQYRYMYMYVRFLQRRQVHLGAVLVDFVQPLRIITLSPEVPDSE